MNIVSRKHHNPGLCMITVITQYTLNEHIRLATVIEKSGNISSLASIEDI
jgi:hypothetical protein